MQNAIMLADTKNLFDPAKRGSIAFDIEGRPDCYLSVCVVVLDDFHLFSFQEPALARFVLYSLFSHKANYWLIFTATPLPTPKWCLLLL